MGYGAKYAPPLYFVLLFFHHAINSIYKPSMDTLSIAFYMVLIMAIYKTQWYQYDTVYFSSNNNALPMPCAKFYHFGLTHGQEPPPR